MKKCVDSLIVEGEGIEIIIVDDGSTDRTAEIADTYARDYPDIVKVIHQENGGHGEAVNTGLRHASGVYFKVVDSDDWVDTSAYQKIRNVLKAYKDANNCIDMFISNFVYEKIGIKHKKTMTYESAFPQNKVFTWRDVKIFKKGQYLLMHSVIYRTELLRECGLKLPAHTFYVDNIFVYYPLPYVKTMYYLNLDFYRYYIGREDQSVHESVMIRRIDQQLKVNYRMIEDYKLSDRTAIPNRKLRHYMRNYLEIMMVVSSIMLICSDSEEKLQKKKQLWEYLKESDRKTYFYLKYGLLGGMMNLPGKSGRKISVIAYQLAQRMVGFN